MNIETIFSLSFKIFNKTLRSIIPFILFYNIFVILISYFFEIENITYSINTQLYTIIPLLSIYIIQLIYFILITQFIFDKINNTKIHFNIIIIIKSLINIIGLYLLIFIPPIIIITGLMSINSGAFFLLGIIPILLFVTIFANYLIINNQKNIIESIIGSYKIITNHLSETIILVMINIVFVFFVIIITAIGNQILPIILSSFLVNILNYFISIFNIYFYYLLNSKFNRKNINE